ncbi:MAG TPA: MATE family efflux transporter [Devosiaceae bacterium]|nr:MATE family efflux transporter [Devosiaceae bacterium]
MNLPNEAAPRQAAGAVIAETGWAGEIRTTFALAWPLIIAQVAQIAFFTTDVIFLGWLGPSYLAAGTLATALMHPLVVGGFGVVLATAPMVAQAIGAHDTRSIRRTVRQGFWAAILLSVVIVPVLYAAPMIFAALGQAPGTVAGASLFIAYAAWSVPPALLFMVLRSFIAAKGNSGVILAITLTAVALNALFNYALVFGNFGMPRLELMGSGISTSLTNLLMFAAALAYAVTDRGYRRHHILVRFWKPDWPRFFEFFRIGMPIGLTLMSEVGLFGVAVIMMGWLGTNEVAAHAVAIQCAAISFMVPLGLSQATTIRVGLAQGAVRPRRVAVAGWTSLGLTLIFMSMTCAAFLLLPVQLAAIFLDPSKPENAASVALAVSYLGVAALFQVVDGAQVSMAASLRGLSDTRVPMLVALVGYWIVGLATAYVCGFVLQWRGVGIWFGLAAGLAFVAVVLTARWSMRERLGLVARPAALSPSP